MSSTPISLGVLLTRRLALIAVALALINLTAVGLRYASLPDELARSALHRQLRVLEAALPAAPGPVRIDDRARAAYAAHPSAYAFAVLDPDGATLDAANPSLLPDAIDGGLPASALDARFDRDGPGLRVSAIVVDHGDTRLRLAVAMAADPAGWKRRALVDELVSHVALPMIPVILLLIGSNAALVRRAMRPVVAAAHWARGLRPGADNRPLPREAPMPEEIDVLVRAIDRALERLDDALAAERRRSAEAAHALRTPLAVLTTRIDGLPADGTGDALRRDVRMLSRTVHQLLAAATADTAPAPGSGVVDLAASASRVIAQLTPFAHRHDTGLELIVDPQGALARADAGAVEVALVNLVENAVVHGGPEVTIEAGPGALLTVRDDGKGLPDDADALFEPFRRGPGAAAGGAGLGLAIVRRVMASQEGRVVAGNHAGGGAEFSLHFQPPES